MELIKQWRVTTHQGEFIVSIRRRVPNDTSTTYAEWHPVGSNRLFRVFLDQPKDGLPTPGVPAASIMMESLCEIIASAGAIRTIEEVFEK
jgi:hypothetical protein